MADDLPASCITWCQAFAFCAGAGKHLCGNDGGGPLPYEGDNQEIAHGQWYAACSNEGLLTRPYGNGNFDPNLCDGSESGSVLRPAGSTTTCEGGVPGLYDMLGNVTEWIDACESDAPDSLCDVRGGSAYDPLADVTCSSTNGFGSVRRDQTVVSVGFRCCL